MIKRLYERGYDRSSIVNLFKFTDWLIILPEELKLSFWEELRVYEEECQIPSITSAEQIGYDRGVREADQAITRTIIRGSTIAPCSTTDSQDWTFESILDLTRWLDNSD